MGPFRKTYIMGGSIKKQGALTWHRAHVTRARALPRPCSRARRDDARLEPRSVFKFNRYLQKALKRRDALALLKRLSRFDSSSVIRIQPLDKRRRFNMHRQATDNRRCDCTDRAGSLTSGP
jgi:hypothetical protein